MKLALGFIGLSIGFVALFALIAHEGAVSTLALLSGAGAIMLWLVPLRMLPVGLDVLGWKVLLPRGAKFDTLLYIALVREAFSRLIPVAVVGGEVIGIRLAARTVSDSVTAAASVVTETVLTLITQTIFALIGLACLTGATGGNQLTRGIFGGLWIGLAVIVSLVAVLQHGSVFERLGRLGRGIVRDRASGSGKPAEIDTAIRLLFAQPVRLAVAAGWQLSGLMLGSAETWLALRWLGHPVGVEPAVALESLTLALRNFAFFIPAGLGVQELGLVGIGQLVGLGGETAIALSLAKRMREVLVGLPALLAWYLHEGRVFQLR